MEAISFRQSAIVTGKKTGKEGENEEGKYQSEEGKSKLCKGRIT